MKGCANGNRGRCRGGGRVARFLLAFGRGFGDLDTRHSSIDLGAIGGGAEAEFIQVAVNVGRECGLHEGFEISGRKELFGAAEGYFLLAFSIVA